VDKKAPEKITHDEFGIVKKSLYLNGTGFLFMIDWEQVRIDAAISAMQGVLESGKLGMVLEAAPEVVAKQSVRLADELIKELKGENESNEKT
jgi:hypothetical protein